MIKWAVKHNHAKADILLCVMSLPDLDREPSKKRVLTDDEIRILWHGLDTVELPHDRRVLLAIKATLLTMLRSWELLGMHKSELATHEDGTPCVDINADRVKKARIHSQPLTSLALEIITEAMGDREYIFAGRWDDAPFDSKAMTAALSGRKDKRRNRSKGICAILGLEPFTAHDLRRTAATLAGRCGFSNQMIEYCLDHQKESNKSVEDYNRAPRKNMTEKRQVLEAVETRLRRIIGQGAVEQKLAA
jgi:integrase